MTSRRVRAAVIAGCAYLFAGLATSSALAQDDDAPHAPPTATAHTEPSHDEPAAPGSAAPGEAHPDAHPAEEHPAPAPSATPSEDHAAPHHDDHPPAAGAEPAGDAPGGDDYTIDTAKSQGYEVGEATSDKAEG